MTNSSKIIDAFNEPPTRQDPLHEVSGITEGKIDGISDAVTVAIVDKNNAGDQTKRSGVDQVAISYVDGYNKTVYQTLDVVKEDGSSLDDFGPEDIDFSREYGVYVIVDEGGMKNGVGHPPTVYTAELKENNNGELQMVIQTETTMNVASAAEDNKNIGFTSYGNGIEGLAIDSEGNVYMGEQDSGIVYKVKPIFENGKISGFEQEAEVVLVTGSNDLAGLDFDDDGNLIVSFGNQATGSNPNYQPNTVVKFTKEGDSFSDNPEILFEGSDKTGTGKNQFDAEAVMFNSDGEIVIGSDNGLKVNGEENNQRYKDEDSTVLVPLDDNVDSVGI